MKNLTLVNAKYLNGKIINIKRISKKDYNNAVLQCGYLIKEIEDTKWVIARISFDVCYQGISGQFSPSWAYTVPKFAKDIGIHPSVLKDHRRYFAKVISKLPKADVKKLDASPQKKQTMRAIAKAVKNDTSRKDVAQITRDVISAVASTRPEDRKLKNIMESMDNFRGFICMYDLTDFDKRHLNAVLIHCEAIVAAIKSDHPTMKGIRK